MTGTRTETRLRKHKSHNGGESGINAGNRGAVIFPVDKFLTSDRNRDTKNIICP